MNYIILKLLEKKQSTYKLFKRLWLHVSPSRRLQFWALLLLMVITSFAEILSIGAVLPFLGVLTEPERITQIVAIQYLAKIFNIQTSTDLLPYITIAFASSALVAGGLRLMLLRANIKLSFAIGSDISLHIYRQTLHQSYAIHIARNSSEIIDSILRKTEVVTNSINSYLLFLGSTVILISIMVVLLSINTVVALLTFSGFAIIYLSIIKITRKRQLSYSHTIAKDSREIIKYLQEGLGGIRDILLDGSQKTYCDIYSKVDSNLRLAQGGNLFISISPRYAMEAFGMVLIASLAYVLAQQPSGIQSAIPILGVMVMGSQRLLPVLQQIYLSYSSLQGWKVSLGDTIDMLDHSSHLIPAGLITEPIKFEHEINLKKISFRYTSDSPFILHDINLTISKGSRVGFIGKTGTGKSTLIDIVMGLLDPTHGELLIDGCPINSVNYRSWQSHIAHVPQSIYLSDSSIEENIAFGVPPEEIDFQRVRWAAELAQMDLTITGWDKQYKTIVGERGIQLSGGQRQRIGIARALYKKADVIIFDEATSALDGDTEEAVMRAIEGLNKNLTILIIAHRLTTLKSCNNIIKLDSKGISWVGNYDDILKN